MRDDVMCRDGEREKYDHKYVVLIWLYQFSMRTSLYGKLSLPTFDEVEIRLRFLRAWVALSLYQIII